MENIYVCDFCGDEIDVEEFEPEGLVYEGMYFCSRDCFIDFLIANGEVETLTEHIENLKDMIEYGGE